MMQIPNLPNYSYQVPQPNYNAVKIDVHNPMVNVPAQTQAPCQPCTPAPMPLYQYPQAPIYNYPPAQTVPYYMPPAIQLPEPPVAQAPAVVPPVVEQVPPVQVQEVPEAPVAESVPAPVITEAPKAVEIQPEVVAVPEAPVVEEAPKTEVEVPAAPVAEEAPKAEEPQVEVVPPTTITPQVDLNSFIAKLTNPDYEVQAAAMEEIANMVNEEPQKATELLDTKIVDALTNIITADTSSLEGPTAEQAAAREKLLANQQLTDDEKALASTISPLEQAERNKSFAMFTSAIMQKLYADEVQKLTNSTVPLTELPGAVTIVEQLKNNPNPTVRTSAIEALSYIQTPEYQKDLSTVFSIAQKDQDKGVQEAATIALEKLNQMAKEAPKTEEQPAA